MQVRVSANKLVEQAFPGQALIPVIAACHHLGIGYKTARNQICAGKFPLPLIKQGVRNYIPAPALAAYLADRFSAAGIPEPDTPAEAQPRRRAGRARKVQHK